MKIIFFGTSSFSVAILKHLLQSPYQVIAVVTRTDKPQGRSLKLTPSPVKQFILAEHPEIPLYQPPKASNEEFVSLLKSLSPDVFVVASYGEIMKQPLLDVPKLGPINVHASLLPKWRGAAPIQRSLMAGETETGVTIMKMVLQLDAGNMLEVAKVKVPLDMNHHELQEALAMAAKEPLLRALSKLPCEGEPQDQAQVTFAAKITPQDAFIDWTKPALQIHNQIRALSPSPGAWCNVEIGNEQKKLKIKKTLYPPAQTPCLSKKEWIVPCGEGALSLLEVQLEGKKSLKIGEFLQGLHHVPKLK